MTWATLHQAFAKFDTKFDHTASTFMLFSQQRSQFALATDLLRLLIGH